MKFVNIDSIWNDSQPQPNTKIPYNRIDQMQQQFANQDNHSKREQHMQHMQQTQQQPQQNGRIGKIKNKEAEMKMQKLYVLLNDMAKELDRQKQRNIMLVAKKDIKKSDDIFYYKIALIVLFLILFLILFYLRHVYNICNLLITKS